MQANRMLFIAGTALAITIGLARAQTTGNGGPYPLHDINFDMWCQEERHLPADRCDKRLAQDDAEYQAYVAKIESYEIPYLQRQEDRANFDRTVIHSDPIDHPVDPSAPQVNQTSVPMTSTPQ